MSSEYVYHRVWIYPALLTLIDVDVAESWSEKVSGEVEEYEFNATPQYPKSKNFWNQTKIFSSYWGPSRH